MAFIQNNKFREIRESAKAGNEKAMKIIQGLRNGVSQDDINNLVSDYYSLETPNEVKEEIATEQILPEEIVPEPQIEQPQPNEVVDWSSFLDEEMNDLLDENEIDNLSFNDFLKNKNRDMLRSRKNADYFKAYDFDGRQNYMNSKIDTYKNKFNNQFKNIDRNYRDMDKSINKYIENTNLELDDGKELDMPTVDTAYNVMTTNEDLMSGFGRSWDDADNQEVFAILREYIQTYGKNNVLAVLNTLKSDNANYRDFRTNQIDSEIGRYSKSIENLLK